MKRSAYGTAWRATVKRAGLPVGTRFHDLRHVYASTLIAAGVHPKVLQERLGHASITETMDTYGHLYPSGLEVGPGAIDTHYGEALTASARRRSRHDEPPGQRTGGGRVGL